MKQRMYIERYVCGESSKLTIGVNSKSSFLNFIVANISDDIAGKIEEYGITGIVSEMAFNFDWGNELLIQRILLFLIREWLAI